MKQSMIKHFFISLALTLASATSQAAQLLDSVAAIVDDSVILESELGMRIEQIKQNFTRNNAPLPPDSELRSGVLNQMILENLQLQVGSRAGVRVSDEQLNAMMEEIAARQGMSLGAFRDELLKTGSYHFVREQLRKDFIIQQVQRGSLTRRVNVTEDEIKAFLASPEGQDLATARYQLAHLLVPIAPDAGSTERQQAKAIINSARKEIATGKNLEKWAQVYNLSHGTELVGGDLGWRSHDELPSLFADIAPKMSIGDISPVLEAGNGYHIVQLIDSSDKPQLIQQSKLYHILIKPSTLLDDKAARDKINDLRNRIINGEDFGAIAQQYSEDIGSAREGGDVGWSQPGMFVPEFEAAAEQTSVGTISEPVRTQFGWHIIYVEDRKMTDMRNESLTNRAYAVLRERKLDDVRDEWLQQIRNNAYVDIK